MSIVYVKISLALIDHLTDFFKKLKDFVGEFTICQQDVHESYLGVITIQFFTDKIKFKEGENRQCEILAKSNEDGTWEFTEIKKIYGE